MPHMEGIFINGEKAKFHPEDILDTDASQYTEEIGESVTAYLTEHLTNPSNPPIDTSLSIAGAAADAKETGDKISELKEDLNKVTEKSINVMPIAEKTTTVNGVTFTYEDGVLTASGTATGSGGRTTPLTETFELPAGTYTFSRDNYALPVFIMSGTSAVLYLTGTTTTMTVTLDSPTTCYLGANVVSGESYSVSVELQIEENTVATDFVFPSEITAFDKVARNDIEKIGMPYQEVDLSWETGKALIYNNGWTDNTGYSYADIELIQGQSIDVTMTTSTVVFPLSVWSEDGSSLIKPCVPLPNDSAKRHYVYSCGAHRERVRINCQTSYRSGVVAKLYNPNNLVNISNILTGERDNNCFDVLSTNVICIGDSLTQGSYTGADLHTDQSYPAFLQKLMGNTVTNAGRAGWSTLEWWNGDSSQQKGFPYYNYSDFDTAVICLGTNGGLTDTIDTDAPTGTDYINYANTNTGAYCKIIEGLKAQNANINIILCNIWSASGTGANTTNEVINKIASKYGLPVVDLRAEFRSEFSVYNAVSGNIHLGRIGYAMMANLIRNAINNNVLERPTNYNYIPS